MNRKIKAILIPPDQIINLIQGLGNQMSAEELPETAQFLECHYHDLYRAFFITLSDESFEEVPLGQTTPILDITFTIQPTYQEWRDKHHPDGFVPFSRRPENQELVKALENCSPGHRVQEDKSEKGKFVLVPDLRHISTAVFDEPVTSNAGETIKTSWTQHPDGTIADVRAENLGVVDNPFDKTWRDKESLL